MSKRQLTDLILQVRLYSLILLVGLYSLILQVGLYNPNQVQLQVLLVPAASNVSAVKSHPPHRPFMGLDIDLEDIDPLAGVLKYNLSVYGG